MWAMGPPLAPAVVRPPRRRSTFEVHLPARALLRGPLEAVTRGVAWLQTARAGAASANPSAANAGAVRDDGVPDPTFDLKSIDWFVWEPVESAHKLVPAHPGGPSGDTKAVPLTEADWESVAIAAPEPPMRPQGLAVLGAPLGFKSATSAMLVTWRPCTVRRLLMATHNFYTSPATAESLERIGELGCGGFSDAVMDELQGNLLDGRPALGRTPMMVDTCGVPAHPDLSATVTARALRYPMRYSMVPPCETAGPLRLYGTERRNPRFHCQGRVRFAGVHIFSPDERAQHGMEHDGVILLGRSRIGLLNGEVMLEESTEMQP